MRQILAPDIRCDVVVGVVGASLYVNDIRVAGPKHPCGGGAYRLHRFRVTEEDMRATPEQWAKLVDAGLPIASYEAASAASALWSRENGRAYR